MAQVSDWHKLYGEGWTGLIVPEAFAHPAKYSRALIRHIYQHLMDEGWLEPGATVIDPFAGVALGALHAMKHGLNWVGVELEQKFVDLGQQNIDLWNSKFSQLPGWGRAVILQGDSRRLTEVVGEAGGCVSSPPWMNSQEGAGVAGPSSGMWEGYDRFRAQPYQSSQDKYGTDPANLGNMPEGKLADAVVSSPPYAGNRFDGGEESLKRKQGFSPGYSKSGGYGDNSPGQLANMPEGEFANAVVSSPPYAGGCSHTGGDDPRPEHIEGGELRYVDYGINEGQLANMPEGEFDGVVASPPYIESLASDNPDKRGGLYRDPKRRNDKTLTAEYGDTNGQLAALPEGEFEAVVSSPPYVDSVGSRDKGGGIDWEKAGRPDRLEPSENRHNVQGNTPMAYGNTDGQLADLPEGEFEACVSSPPYEGSIDHAPGNKQWDHSKGTPGNLKQVAYGEDNENLGNSTGDTFWSAAHQIVQQVYQLLAPGSPAVWVVKAFVRKGKRIDFPGQWQRLCESVGFETVHIHRAWLVEDRGSQFDLFGKLQENQVERKSFFRRLHEQNASAKMYWEQHITDRDTRANYIWRAKADLWTQYHYEVEQNEEDIASVTRSRIATAARALAYADAGKPWMDIDTRIDWEVVLCQRKP